MRIVNGFWHATQVFIISFALQSLYIDRNQSLRSSPERTPGNAMISEVFPRIQGQMIYMR